MFESYRKRVLANQPKEEGRLSTEHDLAIKKRVLELDIQELNRELKAKKQLLQEVTIMMIQEGQVNKQ